MPTGFDSSPSSSAPSAAVVARVIAPAVRIQASGKPITVRVLVSPAEPGLARGPHVELVFGGARSSAVHDDRYDLARLEPDVHDGSLAARTARIACELFSSTRQPADIQNRLVARANRVDPVRAGHGRRPAVDVFRSAGASARGGSDLVRSALRGPLDAERHRHVIEHGNHGRAAEGLAHSTRRRALRVFRIVALAVAVVVDPVRARRDRWRIRLIVVFRRRAPRVIQPIDLAVPVVVGPIGTGWPTADASARAVRQATRVTDASTLFRARAGDGYATLVQPKVQIEQARSSLAVDDERDRLSGREAHP